MLKTEFLEDFLKNSFYPKKWTKDLKFPAPWSPRVAPVHTNKYWKDPGVKSAKNQAPTKGCSHEDTALEASGAWPDTGRDAKTWSFFRLADQSQSCAAKNQLKSSLERKETPLDLWGGNDLAAFIQPLLSVCFSCNHWNLAASDLLCCLTDGLCWQLSWSVCHSCFLCQKKGNSLLTLHSAFNLSSRFLNCRYYIKKIQRWSCNKNILMIQNNYFSNTSIKGRKYFFLSFLLDHWNLGGKNFCPYPKQCLKETVQL